jgi:hypothetical protein
MKQIPTAEDILSKKFNKLRSSFTLKDVEECMIEFAKLHVEAALKEAANEYYPKDKPNFELVAERFINAYPLENIK